MNKFGWGAEFLRINADVLEAYATCADGAEVVKAQVRRKYPQCSHRLLTCRTRCSIQETKSVTLDC